MEMASKQEVIGTMQHSFGLRHVNIKVAKKSGTVDVFIARSGPYLSMSQITTPR